MGMNFLKGITLVDTGRLKVPTTRTPQGMVIRVMSNGAVYPSKELIEKLNLDYTPKAAEGQEQTYGFGFDIIDSSEWAPTKDMDRMLLLGLISRAQPKLSIFNRVKFNPNGTPMTSVLDQGTPSQELLDIVRSLGYIMEDQKYVDLVIQPDNPIPLENEVAWIPKVVERGPRKDQKEYVRRENIRIYQAIPSDMIEEPKSETAQAAVSVTPQ
jgi:hypothetical protein